MLFKYDFQDINLTISLQSSLSSNQLIHLSNLILFSTYFLAFQVAKKPNIDSIYLLNLSIELIFSKLFLPLTFLRSKQTNKQIKPLYIIKVKIRDIITKISQQNHISSQASKAFKKAINQKANSQHLSHQFQQKLQTNREIIYNLYQFTSKQTQLFLQVIILAKNKAYSKILFCSALILYLKNLHLLQTTNKKGRKQQAKKFTHTHIIHISFTSVRFYQLNQTQYFLNQISY
ncbi:hypothetical protein TTHERM_001386049 (macronuclear) [Tetrahymena thermophila SB210]|uniref:Uncharacterized protein n=1 Tax=Tetrahymena thermophila (strain SB210) TaxID=312017 RepID=W7XL97_TETTS|nr:hypothetical protein TTHERM_001386049 [Tetrahymena thermophila SB210]EWS75909.1 hypothetical protein TTHERM_001386049 [Tetrahymena thermophila SB210]|eukprot:XP_012651552.1 hypothetical protein TTHERM_001386049 [Tetrahymena thermophila SB210]